MMVPGSNLFSMAMRLIAPSSFVYTAFASRALNSVGQYVATYASPVTLQGSAQPVPRQYYQIYGLDFQKNYVTFFIQKNIIDIARDVSGDTITFNGVTFQCISKTDWFQQDNWDSVLAVQAINIG